MGPTELVGADAGVIARVGEVERFYPDLATVATAHGVTTIAGRLPLVDDKGRVFDTWAVETLVPRGFPEELPTVVETGGRIPRHPDRHMNVGLVDGECCIGVGAEIYFRLGREFSLLDFVQGPVTSFFVGQTLVELGEPWPQGERAHGVKGIVQFYREALRVPDAQLMSWLRALATDRLEPLARCPCGKRRTLRDCHFARVFALRRRIPAHEVHRTLAGVAQFLSESRSS